AGGGTGGGKCEDEQQAAPQGCRERGGFRHHLATISCSPMKASIRQKLEKTAERFEEVGHLLADPAVAGGSDTFRELSMEYARLEPVAAGYRRHQALEAQLASARELSADADPEM